MKKGKLSVLNVSLFLILLIYCVSLIWPLVWAVFTSVKEQYDFLYNPLGLPKEFVFENFGTVLEKFEVNAIVDGVQEKHGIIRMLVDTLLYAGGSAFVATLVPCVTAYATAKFPKKKMKAVPLK